MDYDSKSLAMHKQKKGKLSVMPKVPLASRDDLSIAYTPGVAAVCRKIHEMPETVYDYTIKSNSVAVISDGSAVLGLGNIGPYAALPVMEGKAALFKEFAGIDAFPLCCASQESDKIIEFVKNASPVFGGVNLEDIAAPKCFDIEMKLQEIGIPVMHDDQHGTAVVLLAALINASKVAGKRIEDLKVVVNGAGAAGTAISHLLVCSHYDRNICRAAMNVIVCDSKGIINQERKDLNIYKKELAFLTNKEGISGGLKDALKDADVFIGVSVGNVLKKEYIMDMNHDPVIFAMANPVPEISVEDAKQAGAFIIGTGRSDYPNQINNVLAFPGIFRGALDVRALRITNNMKLAASHAIASLVEPTREKILPSALDKNVVPAVSKAVADAWKKEGFV